MKIAGIIFAVVAVALLVWGFIGFVKGWQEENEPDPTKMPTKDKMEREDKAKKSRSLASGGIAHGPQLGGEDRPETVVPPNKLKELLEGKKPNP